MNGFPTLSARRAPRGWLISALGLALLLIVNTLPPLLVVRQALTPPDEAVQMPLRLLPESFSLQNLTSLWTTEPLLDRVTLSLGVALATTLLALVMGFPAGWAAVRLARAGRTIASLSLISRVLPPIVIAIPLTAILIPLGLYDHPLGLGLVLAHLTIGLPFAVLLAYAAFRDLPPELEESAIVNGCGTFEAFWRVALPSVRGAVAGAFILVFLLSWDEFAYALLIQLTNRTLPPLIYYYTNYGELGVASTLAVMMLVPAVLVIAFLQGLMTRGPLAGGVRDT